MSDNKETNNVSADEVIKEIQAEVKEGKTEEVVTDVVAGKAENDATEPSVA